MTLEVNLVRTVPSVKFICCYWSNPWRDCHFTHAHRCVMNSDESRIIFLLERPSICQYTVEKFQPWPNCQKTIKSTSTFGPPCTVHCKITKNYCSFWKQPFKNQPKSVIGYAPQLALSPKVVQAVRLESSKCNTSAVFPRVKRINTTTQQLKCRKLFKSFPLRVVVIILFPLAFA